MIPDAASRDLRRNMGVPPVDDHVELLSILGVVEVTTPGQTSLTDLAGMTEDDLGARIAPQVGARWTGTADLPPEWRTAFEAVTKRLHVPKGLDEATRESETRHAFVTGVLLDLAVRADTSGGIAAWGFDRVPSDPVLRAIVTGHGRPSIPVDAFGAVTHWIRERALGKAIPEPDPATSASCLARLVAERVPKEVTRPPNSLW